MITLSPASKLPRRAALTFALALPAIGALAQATTLDGRRFDGVFLERGKTSGDADTLTFQGGRFRSSACDRYGYGDAAYKASALGGDAVAFEAETESPRYGKLRWKGTVRGDKLDATATMVRDGKPPIENWVVAGAAK
jgi:hypothetical protein